MEKLREGILGSWNIVTDRATCLINLHEVRILRAHSSQGALRLGEVRDELL